MLISEFQMFPTGLFSHTYSNRELYISNDSIFVSYVDYITTAVHFTLQSSFYQKILPPFRQHFTELVNGTQERFLESPNWAASPTCLSKQRHTGSDDKSQLWGWLRQLDPAGKRAVVELSFGTAAARRRRPENYIYLYSSSWHLHAPDISRPLTLAVYAQRLTLVHTAVECEQRILWRYWRSLVCSGALFAFNVLSPGALTFSNFRQELLNSCTLAGARLQILQCEGLKSRKMGVPPKCPIWFMRCPSLSNQNTVQKRIY